ncbi:FAD-dependent oxidoreductase [Amycolatopsis ultiminotia]|uniref:FAD-dependent oxidoreductase n=1 Tax=Amycolatopsis ultiminotia TaxID=543629 RepID=A0ABP6V4V5_9PSEU
MSGDGVLVIGAGAAALGVVEGLREQGYQEPIDVVGAEKWSPYDRPPLSKRVLDGRLTPEQTELRPSADLGRLGARWLLGHRVVGLDVDAHAAELDDGKRLRWSSAVVATGLAPRLPGFARGLDGVHVLRTLDDALVLRTEMLNARGIAVVGAGVLGCEIAATARGMGLEVALIDKEPAPMWSRTGHELAAMLATLHTRRGAKLHTGVGVARLEGDGGRVREVVLADGTRIDADLVVVALGSDTATDWLQGSGLTVDDGVVCDAHCRAAPDVYAAGDVARWYHEGLGRLVRREDRTNASAQGLAVARRILGDTRPYAPMASSWTNQYDVSLHFAGELVGENPEDTALTVVSGNPGEGKFAATVAAGEHVIGAVGWNDPRGFRAARAAIGRPSSTAA